MLKRTHTLLSYIILATAVPAVVYRFIEAPGWMLKLNLLGFFTIQSNILVIAIVLLSLMGFHFSRKLELAVAAAITITAIIFQLFLRQNWNPQGWSNIVSNINHGSTTVLFLIWFWFSPEKEKLSIRNIFAVIPYPAAYCIFGVTEGIIKGNPRYFFLNISEMGWSGFGIWFVALTALFVISGFFILFMDNVAKRVLTVSG